MVRAGRDVVVDGRDIGTVVFPDADLKIFLTASPEARAGRRISQRGAEAEPDRLEAEAAALAARDHADSTRPVAPLRRRGGRGPARHHRAGVRASRSAHRGAGPARSSAAVPMSASPKRLSHLALAGSRFILHGFLPRHFRRRRVVTLSRGPAGAVAQRTASTACSINFNPRPRPVHLPHRPPRPAGPLRRRLLRRRLRADALDVRGHHGADRRG